jgi:hypothetical protein
MYMYRMGVCLSRKRERQTAGQMIETRPLRNARKTMLMQEASR